MVQAPVCFIVDARLPPALACAIAAAGHDAVHVGDIGLLAASDTAIWDAAAARHAVLITKDEDFAIRHWRGDRSVRVVWLRLGNIKRAELLRLFMPRLPQIEHLIRNGDVLIEVRP